MSPESSIERQVAELLALSREFTRFLENSESLSTEQFNNFLFRINILLYASGMALPETAEPDSVGEHLVTEEHWERIYNDIHNKLGENDVLFFSTDSDISTGSIGEYCADIYQDLKDFEHQISKGTTAHIAYAVYEIKQLFKKHWGIRLLRIQNQLHQFIYPETEISDDFELID
jgi:hypothetical protein